MPDLSDDQIADLRLVQEICERFHADVVIIGAIAYQIHFPNEARHTADVDLAVALDLDEFARLEESLTAAKWTRVPNREHRGRSGNGGILDLLPAGPKLRAAKQVIWPESQFTMSGRLRSCLRGGKALHLCRRPHTEGDSSRRSSVVENCRLP